MAPNSPRIGTASTGIVLGHQPNDSGSGRVGGHFDESAHSFQNKEIQAEAARTKLLVDVAKKFHEVNFFQYDSKIC